VRFLCGGDAVGVAPRRLMRTDTFYRGAVFYGVYLEDPTRCRGSRAVSSRGGRHQGCRGCDRFFICRRRSQKPYFPAANPAEKVLYLICV
jgi:hypothetical protein